MKDGSYNYYPALVLRWGYLITLILGYGVAGWLLAAFQVSWVIWSITFALAAQLIRSGPAAIVLASSWVTGLMCFAALTKTWIPAWDGRLPYTHAERWAQALLIIWFGAIGLTVLSGYTVQLATRPLGLGENRAAYGVVILIGIALVTGGFSF